MILRPIFYFNVGDESIISLSISEAIDSKSLFISGSYTYESAQIVATLLDSAINAGDLGITFTVGETRTNDAVYGSNVLTLLYIAIAIVLVAAIVIPFVKYKGFGGVSLYSTLSYLIITTICFAFISTNVFEVTLGTAAIFLLGLLVTLFMNGRVYNAIKEEVALGKTVDSSVKAGYKKTLAGAVDTYAVLVLASVALLIGGAGVHTLALQALICFISGAFISLLWSRFINCMLVSVAKDKYKYYGFVREDDDDE
jgi:SecD/SecF fusion protein